MKLILILVTLLVTFAVTHARDPDLPPPEHYGERPTVGGSEWTGGDTFIAIALPVAVVLMLALPHIFDGEYQDWPVYKFRLLNKRGHSRTMFKFPMRQLCESY